MRTGARELAAAVRLSRVVARLEAEGMLVSAPPADPEIRGAADDSRDVAGGELFCAWRGTTMDGHVFLPAAEQAGAVAAVVETPVPAVALPQVVARDGRRAAALAAAVAYGEPEAALRVAGVTGTNGKTTTVWLIRHVLSARWPTASLGTLGAILPDGSVLAGSENLTTPGPVELARTLRYLVDRGARALAMEVSSHALDQGRTHALGYDVAVFTNLSRDHLDYHGTLERYLQAKLALCERIRPDGTAVINAEDSAWRDVPGRAPRTMTFGFSETAQVRATHVRLAATGSTFQLSVGKAHLPVRVPLPGAYNVKNALAAAASALALGLTPGEVAARLSTTPQVPGRLERIADRPCPVLRDYAHTPDALERALGALRPLTRGRLIVVFGAGGDRDRGKRPLMGATAARGADIAIVTSDNPRTEDPDAIIDEIVTGMPGAAVLRVTDRRQAIAEALRLARADDTILLAGKGHERYQVVGQEKRPFDERVVVAELLSEGSAEGVR